MWFKIVLQCFHYFILDNFIHENFVSALPFVGDNLRLAERNEFSFAAAITKRTRTVDPNEHTICTASLISVQDAITAYHCLKYKLLTGIQVIVGSNDLTTGSRRFPAWVIGFEDWAYARRINNGFDTNDLCIIRVTRPVTNIIPVQISYLSYQKLRGKTVTAMGWGKLNNGTLPRVLHTASMKVMRNTKCVDRIYSINEDNVIVDDNYLCAVREPYAIMSGGDSGGPLLYRNKLVGVSCQVYPLGQDSFHPDNNAASAEPIAGENLGLAAGNEFPFVAALTKRVERINPDTDFLCTASLISIQNILTADHCLDDEELNGIQILIGSNNVLEAPKYYVAWWIPFDAWAQATNQQNGYSKNDICIIRMTTAVDGIYPVPLAYISYANLKLKSVVAMGWGRLENGSIPNILRTARLKVLRNRDCENRVFTLGDEYLKVDKNLICAVREPYAIMMDGDSGGPLMYHNKVVAINRGTCPLPDLYFHPGKVNLFSNLKFYKKYVIDILSFD